MMYLFARQPNFGHYKADIVLLRITTEERIFILIIIIIIRCFAVILLNNIFMVE